MFTIKVIHTTECCNCNSEIISLLKQIKMGQEQLEAKLAELKQTITDEKAEVSAKLETLQATVDSLKDQLANGATPEAVAAAITQIDEAIADIKTTVEPDVVADPEPEPPAEG